MQALSSSLPPAISESNFLLPCAEVRQLHPGELARNDSSLATTNETGYDLLTEAALSKMAHFTLCLAYISVSAHHVLPREPSICGSLDEPRS